ncbi:MULTISPECIES: hypothetical protein [unclassified Acinetobacter]|uniref:hypothetical protein n=1 Tax=unclassified Acinetobacter TaxID=196816 RepID=UPI00244AE80F|nr:MULTISPECIES: hypothetical protein [unclassified Acinetobacter]MDH0031719.1 hypothetical protein [Acinetobacter sp. GD04021]MDH0887436.1 hypothetical protein [Acinetobacter sp. GD03873]MDH1083777.1 hypothetical protein [Acinetobacter sp. GD03983]MDH2190752.1 hypothetical protein [Acinetobacter sp. GD03645]MDH2204304.1 hypothetical protein [Acinetobacter sp. GD03647]
MKGLLECMGIKALAMIADEKTEMVRIVNPCKIEVLPNHCLIMVAERKRVDRLVSTPAHPKVSLSRPTATGGDEEFTHKTIPQKE